MLSVLKKQCLRADKNKDLRAFAFLGLIHNREAELIEITVDNPEKKAYNIVRESER